MNYRHMVAVSLLACVAAGCSLTPKDETTDAADQTAPERSNLQLMEVQASSKLPLANKQTQLSLSQSDPEAPTAVTRKRVEFVFGTNDGSLLDTESVTSVNASYSPDSGPLNYAPSYPERPVPTRGESKDVVLAELGEPPHRLPGNAGAEVWDYGTFRVFFQNEKVAFTRVW